MKKLFITIIGLFLLQTAIAQEWHSLNSKTNESYTTTLLKSTDNSVVVDLVLNGFYTNEVDVIDTKIAQPRKSTLDFLKQFARTYHYEKKIEASLGNMILN